MLAQLQTEFIKQQMEVIVGPKNPLIVTTTLT